MEKTFEMATLLIGCVHSSLFQLGPLSYQTAAPSWYGAVAPQHAAIEKTTG